MVNTIQKEVNQASPRKRYSEHTEAGDFEPLKDLYGRNKKLPRGYELQALIALSHYPELKNISIEFVFEASNTPLSTQPSKSSLFVSSPQRKYLINISKKARHTMQSVLLRNLTFNQQVGAIGHELGHIIDYMNKTSFQVIGTGIFYYINSYKRKLESGVDAIAIKHGLGYQILDYSELVMELKKIYPEDKYYRTYHQYYMSPGEIRSKMKQLKMYS